MRNKKGNQVDQIMTNDSGKEWPGFIDEPVFELMLVIQPDQNSDENRAKGKDKFIYLVIIRFYKTKNFLHLGGQNKKYNGALNFNVFNSSK